MSDEAHPLTRSIPHDTRSFTRSSHDRHTVLQTQHKPYNCYVTIQFSRSPQRGKLAERHEAGATAGGREENDLGDAQVRLHLGAAKPRVLGGLGCYWHTRACKSACTCHVMPWRRHRSSYGPLATAKPLIEILGDLSPAPPKPLTCAVRALLFGAHGYL